MSTTEDLRNAMKNAFNRGKKYMLAIKCSGGVQCAYAEAPSLLGVFILKQYGAKGIESFVRGDSNIYEIRNDHHLLKDGWFLQPIDFSISVN